MVSGVTARWRTTGLRFNISSIVARAFRDGGKERGASLRGVSEVGARTGVLGGAPFSEFRLKALSPIVAELELAVTTLSANGGGSAS